MLVFVCFFSTNTDTGRRGGLSRWLGAGAHVHLLLDRPVGVLAQNHKPEVGQKDVSHTLPLALAKKKHPQPSRSEGKIAEEGKKSTVRTDCTMTLGMNSSIFSNGPGIWQVHIKC